MRKFSFSMFLSERQWNKKTELTHTKNQKVWYELCYGQNFSIIVAFKRVSYDYSYLTVRCLHSAKLVVLQFQWTDIIIHNENLHWKWFLAWNALGKESSSDDSMYSKNKTCSRNNNYSEPKTKFLQFAV